MSKSFIMQNVTLKMKSLVVDMELAEEFLEMIRRSGVKINVKPVDEHKLGKTIKRRMGEFGNVHLTEKQLTGLSKEFGEAETMDMIRKMDEYIEARGTKYKNHHFVLRQWFERQNRQVKHTDINPFQGGLK